MIERRFQEETVATYTQELNQISTKEAERILQEAKEYNNVLSQTKGAVIGNLNEHILSDESYNEQLNVSGNGVMGAIEIPKINVNLPIWHGTEEEALSNGAGHFRDSSLPVGGMNSRCILTSHRGLPSAKLFTRLDELEMGDLFYLQVCGNTLAYQIYEIEVIEPDELEKLRILPEKDIVTLVTCTPYGLNTHRLVVSGERVSFEQKSYDAIEPKMLSLRELVFLCIPGIFVFTVLFMYMREKMKERCRTHAKI